MIASRPSFVPTTLSPPLIPDMIQNSPRTGWDFEFERYELWFSYNGRDIKIIEVYDLFVYSYMKKHLPPILYGTWYGVNISGGRAAREDF